MPTIAQLRNSVRNQALGQIPTDDSRLTDRFIDYLVRSVRSRMVISDSERGTGIDQAYYQQVDCIEVKCGKVSCPGIGEDDDLQYADISVVESGRDGIAFLGTIDGDAIQRRSLTSFIHAIDPRFGVKKGIYTVIKDRLVFKYLPAGVSRLRMHAVLEDPMAKTCMPLAENDPYPMPNNRVHELEVLCLKQLISTLPIQPDTVNDARDTATIPGRPNPNIQ